MTIPVNDGLDKNVHVESCVLLERVSNRKPDAKIRIAYNIGLLIICISEIVFSILGKTGVITDHKIIVLYLFSLFVFQIVIGKVVYHQLRRKY